MDGSESDQSGEVMQLFYEADLRLSQKFNYVFDLIKPYNCYILEPHYQEWFCQMKLSQSNAFLRNSFRYFQDATVDESVQGALYELCYETFMNPKKAVAIRVFSMTACFTIAKNYTELLSELKEAILMVRTEDLTAGMRSRSKKLLHKIDKIKKS